VVEDVEVEVDVEVVVVDVAEDMENDPMLLRRQTMPTEQSYQSNISLMIF